MNFLRSRLRTAERVELWSAILAAVTTVALIGVDLFGLWRIQAGTSVPNVTWGLDAVTVLCLTGMVAAAATHVRSRSRLSLVLYWVGLGLLVDLTTLSDLLLAPSFLLALVGGVAAVWNSRRGGRGVASLGSHSAV